MSLIFRDVKEVEFVKNCLRFIAEQKRVFFQDDFQVVGLVVRVDGVVFLFFIEIG